MKIKFCIYGEPISKGRPRMRIIKGKIPIVYTPSKTRKQEEAFITQAMPFKPEKPLVNPLSINVITFFSIPASFSKKQKEKAISGYLRPAKKPDIDNIVKSILDSMNKIFYQDDKQVVEMSVKKFYSEAPRTEIEIVELE